MQNVSTYTGGLNQFDPKHDTLISCLNEHLSNFINHSQATVCDIYRNILALVNVVKQANGVKVISNRPTPSSHARSVAIEWIDDLVWILISLHLKSIEYRVGCN